MRDFVEAESHARAHVRRQRSRGRLVAAARRVRGPEARILAVADGLDTIVELAG